MDNLVIIYRKILSPLFFLTYAFMIRCVLISFYSLILYGAVHTVKKLLSTKMSVRAHYYSWYALLLSIPLSGLWYNSMIKVPLYCRYLNVFYKTGYRLSKVVLFLWFLIVLLRLGLLLVSSYKIRQSINQMEPFPDRECLKQKAAEGVGLFGKHINVVISDSVHSPVSYGIRRKTILLPRDYESRYSTSELYLLLLHEMAHLKNHDTVKIQIIAFVECFLWIPCFFVRDFKRDTEIFCDNRVIGIQGKRDIYEELLLKESTNKTMVKGFAFSDSYHTISSRLQALNAYRPVKHKRAAFSIAIFTVLLFTIGGACFYSADWFFYNDNVDSQYTIQLIYGDVEGTGGYDVKPVYGLPPTGNLSSVFGDVQPLSYDPLSDDIYEVSDGAITIDLLALYEAVKPFDRQDMPINMVTLLTTNYHVEMGAAWSSGQQLGYTFDIDRLAAVNESNRYDTQPLQKRAFATFTYWFVAHFG